MARHIPAARAEVAICAAAPGALAVGDDAGRHGAGARKMGIPLAPFLALGTIVGLFAGHAILHAYLSSMH